MRKKALGKSLKTLMNENKKDTIRGLNLKPSSLLLHKDLLSHDKKESRV